MQCRVRVGATHGLLVGRNDVVVVIALPVVAHGGAAGDLPDHIQSNALFSIFHRCRRDCKVQTAQRLAQIAPGVPQLADLMGNFSWQAMLFASVAGLAIILVMLSVTMPLFSRFGMTKGVRYLPLLIIIGVFFAFQLDGNGPPPEFVANVLNLLESPAGTIAIAAGVLAITAAVYAISAVISTKLYRSASSSERKRSAP